MEEYFMKLDGLRNNIVFEDAPVGALLGKEKKLGYLQAMLAMQGLDPYPIINKIRRHIDPIFAKREEKSEKMEKQQAALADWLKTAKRGEIRKGTSHGRKIEIVVTESVFSKIREILNSRKESKILSKAFDDYPELAYIVRVARQSDESVHMDPVFWNVVDRVTKGKSEEVRKLVNAQYDIDELGEARELSEGVISEAKVSSVMLSLGLDPNAVAGLMKQYGIEDKDYDASELEEKVKPGLGGEGGLKHRMGDVGRKVGEKIGEVGEKIGEFPVKAKKFGKMMMSKDIRNENEEYAEDVVKVAYILMQMSKEGSVSPEDLTKGAG